MSLQAVLSVSEQKAVAVFNALDREILVEKPCAPRPANSRNQDWRNKEKVKTLHILIALCLNVGIDPPDVVRMKECAKLECWTDPLEAQAQTLQKPTEVIGDKLVEQYKSLQKAVTSKQQQQHASPPQGQPGQPQAAGPP
eukprot:RCo027223